MTLYEEFAEKYVNDKLLEFFIEKRKRVLETSKQDYLNRLIKNDCLEEDIRSVAKFSFDAYQAYAKATFEMSYMISKYGDADMKTKSMLFSESNKSLCCKILNEITYSIEMEFE